MTDATDNPRAVMGGNDPPLFESFRAFASEADFGKLVTDFLNEDYKQWPKEAVALLEEARALPERIETDDEKAKTASVVKRIRDLKNKLDAFHKKEKEPWFRGGQACDQFFFGMIDKLLRRDKKNKAGAGDILLARIGDYDDRVIAAETERRRLEADRLAAEARKRQEEEAAATVAAEEARLAAERARNPVKIEEKTGLAVKAEDAAATAAAEVTVANKRAEDAHVATLAKPVSFVRQRADDGTLSTSVEEKYAEVLDRTKLNKELLWPFFTAEAIEKALNAYARSTDYRTPMEGASIGRRNKPRVV